MLRARIEANELIEEAKGRNVRSRELGARDVIGGDAKCEVWPNMVGAATVGTDINVRAEASEGREITAGHVASNNGERIVQEKGEVTEEKEETVG